MKPTRQSYVPEYNTWIFDPLAMPLYFFRLPRISDRLAGGVIWVAKSTTKEFIYNMELIQILTYNLFSPTVMFFVLGTIAGLVKSDLKMPESISSYLSIYMMISIGFKGGVAISTTPSIDSKVLSIIISGIAISFLQPFLSYYLIKSTTKIDSHTASTIAAQYGSISIVTFVAGETFLQTNNVLYGSYIIAILALMEAPAIISGLFLANKAIPLTSHDMNGRGIIREILVNGTIFLLLGSFVIGLISGGDGWRKVEGFLGQPFQGMLCLFMLDMGLIVAKNSSHFKYFSWPLTLFCIYMPMIGASVGVLVSYIIGLDAGSSTLFTILCASASYIAVPAAMRVALPEAKAAIYLPMSLAITFPFNVIVGVPLYYSICSNIFGG